MRTSSPAAHLRLAPAVVLIGTACLAGLLGVGPVAAAEDVSILEPVSPPATAIRTMFWLVTAIAAGIFVVVEAVLLYCVLYFRRPAAPDGKEPPQVYGSKPIEIAWTAAPALVVFILVLVIIRTEYQVRASPPEPKSGDRTLFVTVIGHQWWWEYVYDHYDGRPLGVIAANELHVPAGERVYLKLKSADVCHSYWVPRLAGKTDLIPGRVNDMWFETDRPGVYLGQCAEYCGTQHANMLLRVVVEPPDKFEPWLNNQAKPAADDPAVRDGRDTFLSQSCVNCHRIRGTAARGTYAPDLTHLMSRQTLAAGVIDNTPENLRKWVADPQKVKPGCLMPAFGLSERELDRVVAYLQTLR